MEINWLELLNSVQDIRSALEVWGITYEVLLALGVAALILFLISLREIAVWYLRISQLQQQMTALSAQLAELKVSVDKAKLGTAFPEPQGAAPKKFNLDH